MVHSRDDLCADEAGRDERDIDSKRLHLHPHAVGESVQGCLGGCIGAPERTAGRAASGARMQAISPSIPGGTCDSVVFTVPSHGFISILMQLERESRAALEAA